MLKTYITLTAGTMFFIAFIGCGPEPGKYQGETLTFEAPVSSKDVKKTKDEEELDLDEHSSNFHFTRFGLLSWGPAYAPTYDYYRSPIPIEVPVNPFFSVVDFVHPFYAYAVFSDWWDNDDGHEHRRHHRDNDDDR